MNSYKKVVDAAIRASINPDSMRSQYSPDNKYKLGTSLGAGGHGVVYMGQDVQTHEPVAVKITNDYNRNATYREVNILRRLQHKSIIAIKDFQEQEKTGRLFTIIELCSGGELFNKIVQSPIGYLPEHIAKYYFKSLIEGIAYMHEQGVAHRDIKPENLLLSKKNELKITDFGLSIIVQKNPLQKDRRVGKTMCGSAFYAAPEIWSLEMTGPYDPFKADIWSCGIVLYAMLVGKPPIRVARAVCPMFRALNSNRFQFPQHLSQDAIELIKQCLCVDSNSRPRAPDLLKCKWLQDDRANKVPQKALDVLLRTVIGDRTKWATHEELLQEGWLGNVAKNETIAIVNGNNNMATKNGINNNDNNIENGSSDINTPECLKILKDASGTKKKEEKEEEEEVKSNDHDDDDDDVVTERPSKRAKIITDNTSTNSLSDREKKEQAVNEEKEFEPARQIVGLGWTGMMCARENARKRVQESLKSIGLVIVDVDDDDKKGRSEIVAVASTGLTKAMASGMNVPVTKAMIKDAYNEVGTLMAEDVPLTQAQQFQQRQFQVQQQQINGVVNPLNVPIHKDECPLVAKVTIYEELNQTDNDDNNIKHTIHFNRGAGDMFAYHGLYKMIRSKLKDLNQGSF